MVAGSFANGLLTDEFPISYSLKYEEALLKLVNQSSLTIAMGEPFETLEVSPNPMLFCMLSIVFLSVP